MSSENPAHAVNDTVDGRGTKISFVTTYVVYHEKHPNAVV